MQNFKDVLYFKIPVRHFILDEKNWIDIGGTKFKLKRENQIPPKEIAANFFKGLAMKVKYDADQDDTIFIDFEIKYLPEEKMLEGVRL